MFRRPGKNPLDENSGLYHEETSLSSPYSKYGKRNDLQETPPSRLFEPVHNRATPMESEESWATHKTAPLPHHFENMLSEEQPETTLGEGVSFRGQLSFERYLRIDGCFEGELLSQGKVIIGPKGKVKANLTLREAIIEGELEGNITVQEKLELRGEAVVRGDIQAKSLCVDEGVTICGQVLVSPKELQCTSDTLL